MLTILSGVAVIGLQEGPKSFSTEIHTPIEMIYFWVCASTT